jgi:O-acetyl-ADP-ribose deacetylase (regulator of RNase III)/NAD-dependent SIR2 family protein deacetylase
MARLATSGEVTRLMSDMGGQFAVWIGAGLSLEAGIKASREICDEIKTRLAKDAGVSDTDTWARENLDWDDLNRRYYKCISRLGNRTVRIQYFRRIIRDVQPSFSHHAIALLMQRNYIRPTCLTTNFDKLLEMAFAQHAISEYQAIRSDVEVEYWGEEEKFYILKLHGDYDTANILNTSDETIRIPGKLRNISTQLLQRSGLVVLGSSGYEQSVLRYFDELWERRLEGAKIHGPEGNILDLGVYWGVYMGDRRPTGMGPDAELAQLQSKIADGNVSRNIVESAERAEKAERDFSFFPLWGSGQFLYELIERLDDDLAGEARHYLDHKMRLRVVLGKGGLNSGAIDARLRRLDERAQQERDQGGHTSPRPDHALRAAREGKQQQIDLLYGDLASRSLLAWPEFGEVRRAVISPDDTFLSAGGGAALALLQKAGKTALLSEIAKFQPVSHRSVAVTSAFNLPVNYILHAATVTLNADGSSDTTADDVRVTMLSALRAAQALSVYAMFVPLIGAGTEAVPASSSLDAILAAFWEFIQVAFDYPLKLALVIRHEAELSRNEVGRILKTSLPEFGVTFIPVSTA